MERTKTYVDSKGNVSPEWMTKLEREYERLVTNLTREVNVVDYGAIGDGKTDCTAAFNKAIGTGRVKVYIPEGIFITKGIRLHPVHTLLALVNAAQSLSSMMVREKEQLLITNANHWKGNHHLFVQGMSLDWNVERLGDVNKTATWGNHSSCLTYANVTFGWVKEVEGNTRSPLLRYFLHSLQLWR